MKLPNKTWVVFSGLIFLNVPLFILGLMDIFDSWPLYQIPLWQAAWLYSLADTIGFDVYGKANDFAASPNFLGWILILIGSSLSLILNYLVAKLIVRSFRSRAE